MAYERIIDGSRKRLFDFQELFQYKELFYFFAWRDIKIKYKQTLLGFLWAIIQPMLMIIIFSLFFSRTIDGNQSDIPYPVFVFCGLLMWNIFSTGLTSAANSMVNNSMIIKKIYFPRIVILSSAIVVSVFDFIMAFVVFLFFLLFYKVGVNPSAIFYWPLAVLLASLATLGPGSLIAALNVKYRDFRYVIPFLVQTLFFVSPIIYPVSLFKVEWLQWIIAVSPVYAPIELFRIPVGGSIPDQSLIIISCVSLLFWVVTGLVYFRSNEDNFADLV